ncbi:MAG: M15 family metallopeptidase [Microthrixaceae bacterium]|nr:M15 family metallopeptidase [Microthrixaceae bacterium]MCO5319513.1 M15 family metallopeptidase [Microthrixaceae bacterium]
MGTTQRSHGILRRFAIVGAPMVLLAAMVVATPASAGGCGGTGGDSAPEGRPFREGAEEHPPEVRKYLTMTTANADGVWEPCECTASRDWDWGLDPAAIDSIMAAMDAKELIAIRNYGAFGVPAEEVPVAARTIWFRTTWRSNAEQACLRRLLGSGAAPPGRSRHEWGMAVDIEDWGPASGGLDAKLLEAAGWCRTVRSEPWHYEYRPVLERFGLGYRCIK